MEPREIYLDNNATTHPLPEVRAAVLNAMGDSFGSPSSSHAAGDRSREKVRNAKSSLASLTGCEPTSIIFTSGATEANNTVIRSFSGAGKRIVSTAVEHSSVLAALQRVEGEGSESCCFRSAEAGSLIRTTCGKRSPGRPPSYRFSG